MKPIEKTKDGFPTFYADSIASWRYWLAENCRTEKNVWLVIFKKDSNIPSITYDQAVDEAICFGWIDSKINKRDVESFYQFFAKRNPKSNWSRVNKKKVEKLLELGKMTEAGLEMIRIAKESGTWNALDDVENLVIPKDLETAFGQFPNSRGNFHNFPRSTKRGILEWIFNAKRPETRQKRIETTAESASRNERANQFKKK